MAELVQIVATKPDGECPVALTDFIPLKDAGAQVAEFRDTGYGSRQKSRPLLEIRDQSGSLVEVEGGEKKKPSNKE